MAESCKWEGTIATLQDHLNTCEFTPLPCPNQCKEEDSNDIKHIMRKDMKQHLKECMRRTVLCLRCGMEDTFTRLTQHHEAVCEKKPIPCPECKETVLQGDLKEHLEDVCEAVDLPCKYENLGCEERMKRCEIAEHDEEKQPAHLHMALITMNRLRREFRRESRITILTFKLPEFQSKKDQNVKFLSPAFYTSSTGYKMCITVYANGKDDGANTHVSIFVQLMKGEHDAQLNWPLIGKVTFALLNQLEDRNHDSETLPLTIADSARVGDEWGYKTFIPHSELGHNPAKNIQYLKDDTLFFKVFIEVPARKPWLECALRQ